ncbi:MAG: hypothetical protein VB045_10455 [Synergistaceae bacterium]|nr:hypothetical protein [Synergistaceae bacterium]
MVIIKKRFLFSVPPLLLLLLWCAFVPPPAAEGMDDPSQWSFSATSYVWASGLVGTVGVKGHKARIDLSFSDILGNMDASGMLAFHGHKGRQYFFFNGLYLDQSDTEPLSSGISATVDVTMTLLEAAWGFRVLEEESSSLHLFAGARYWDLKNGLAIRSGSGPIREFHENESWLDPIVGFRWTVRLSPRLQFVTMADVGGFGMGSDFSWGAMTDLSWALSDRTSVQMGYRYLSVDYEKNGFIMDAYNDGFFIGFTWRL